MKKNQYQLKRRKAFVNMAITKPKEFSKYLYSIANTFENISNTDMAVQYLKDLLFMSEASIYNDLKQSVSNNE